MERTGGEPDVVGHDKKTGEYIFYDCSEESPKGRRSVCYDREALEARKEHKPKDSAVDMATAMGIELLTEEQYRELQKPGEFDTKTSSWVKTPPEIRKLDGALLFFSSALGVRSSSTSPSGISLNSFSPGILSSPAKRSSSASMTSMPAVPKAENRSSKSSAEALISGGRRSLTSS